MWIPALVEALPGNVVIQGLLLVGKSLHDDGAVALAEGLKGNGGGGLRELSLAANTISNKGAFEAGMLARCSRTNRKLSQPRARPIWVARGWF